MTLQEGFSPLVEFGFMRRAVVASVALGLGCGPIGVWLTLRRMSLTGDALSHALLPGAAIGFVVAGMSLTALTLGALGAGLVVALGAGWVARRTPQREDASFAAFYLLALAAGVMLVATHGTQVDVLHLLFGSVLAVDAPALLLVSGVAATTLGVLALVWRPLVAECIDPGFLRQVSRRGDRVHLVFMALVVLNLVAAFQALGTLMAVGLMMLPATAARFWVRSIGGQCALAAAWAGCSGVIGLLLSYHRDWPGGPAIVLVAGLGYLASLALGPHGGLLRRH
jgi:zinc/manganese transport system permease protein